MNALVAKPTPSLPGLDEVHYHITKLRPPYTKTLSTPQVRAATTRIEQYLATNCAKKSG